MKHLSRRAFLFTAGAFFAVSDVLLGTTETHAWMMKGDDEEDEVFAARCHEQHGVLGGVIGDVCENTDADRQCQAEHGSTSWFADKAQVCVTRDPSQPLCFLTTACVGHAGLADDCFELEALRRFRDEVLALQPGGADDIALYYATAPRIVERMASVPDAQRDFARLYALYILPCALAAKLGLSGLTRRLYTRMMQDLSARYRVALVART